MQKNKKKFSSEHSTIRLAMLNVTSGEKDQFIKECKSKSQSQYRRYTKPNFELWRCESWFVERCVKYLKMPRGLFIDNVKDIEIEERMAKISERNSVRKN